MALDAFYPQGNTITLALTTVATTAIAPSTGSISGMRIANLGSVTAYVAFGALCVFPSSGTPANGIPIPPGTAESFNVPPNSTVSALVGSGTGSIAATAGFGV